MKQIILKLLLLQMFFALGDYNAWAQRAFSYNLGGESYNGTINLAYVEGNKNISNFKLDFFIVTSDIEYSIEGNNIQLAASDHIVTGSELIANPAIQKLIHSDISYNGRAFSHFFKFSLLKPSKGILQIELKLEDKQGNHKTTTKIPISFDLFDPNPSEEADVLPSENTKAKTPTSTKNTPKTGSSKPSKPKQTSIEEDWKMFSRNTSLARLHSFVKKYKDSPDFDKYEVRAIKQNELLSANLKEPSHQENWDGNKIQIEIAKEANTYQPIFPAELNFKGRSGSMVFLQSIGSHSFSFQDPRDSSWNSPELQIIIKDFLEKEIPMTVEIGPLTTSLTNLEARNGEEENFGNTSANDSFFFQNIQLIGGGATLFLILVLVYKIFSRKKAAPQQREKIVIGEQKLGTKAKISARPSVQSLQEEGEEYVKPASESPLIQYTPIEEPVQGKGFDLKYLGKVKKHKKAYIYLDLNDHWDDTAIGKVFIHQSCYDELNAFIDEQQIEEMVEEQKESIPEIGGFILGKYGFEPESNQYSISLEKFAPVKAETQGVYSIEFGVAWAGNQLADVQDAHQEYETIAWFHTHPGHGLFLSHADLNIHQGFFQKRYHLAMEIDPLSEDWEMALFSRTKAGAVNNTRDLKKDSKWFHWKKLMKKST